jgi:DeoR/GlpR family transcriptional regulator of sugar metabolism
MIYLSSRTANIAIAKDHRKMRLDKRTLQCYNPREIERTAPPQSILPGSLTQRRRMPKHSIADERRRAIVQQLVENQVVTVSDLSDQHGVSEVAIRRDLESLEDRGLLRRIHGGAVALPATILANGSSDHRCAIPTGIANSEIKHRLGRAAAASVRSGERVIFDSGSTVLHVAHYVAVGGVDALTAITSSLPVVSELAQCGGVNLIILGGVYLTQFRMVVGPQTTEQLRGLHADKFFLGADGLTFSYGLTASNVLEAEVDRVAVAAASEVIVVSDSSKIGVVGLTPILPLAKINKLITDSGASSDFVAALREQGIEVVLV